MNLFKGFHSHRRYNSSVPARAVADQLSRLRAGTFSLAPVPLGCLGEKGILQLDIESSAADGEALEGAEQPEAAEVDDQVLDKADLREILAAHEDCKVSLPTGFFVSGTRWGLCWRLHYAGFCFRVPGEHIKTFEDWGQSEPADHVYSLRCKDCFPVSAAKDVDVEASDADGSSSDSGPSSEEEEEEEEAEADDE